MKSLEHKTALVFGEDTRSFLSVTRSLAKAGMQVDVVCFNNTSAALKSKSIRQTYGLNHQAMTMLEWTDTIKELLISQQYDLVIPCDERSLFPLIDIKEELQLNTVFAVPERDNLAPLFNKVDTRITAELCGVAVAKGEKLDLANISFAELSERFGLPFVLKPTQSYAEEALNKRQSVKIARNIKDLNEFKQHNANQLCLVESYFTGYGVGVSILAKNGQVSAAFAHARVAEPESGGGSSYRKAIPLNPSMLFACQKYCMHLKYTGVAMFEFKYNPQSRDWILIEINARFWGSLPLAIFAGIDFPAMLAATLLDIPVEDKLNYNHKAYARNFSADIYAMQKEFNSHSKKYGTLSAGWELTKRLASFTRLLTGNDSIDSFQWHDQRPFWQEFYDLFKDKLHKLPLVREKLQQKRITLFQQQLPVELNKIYFVCYGNIMRSPFAGKLFQQKVANTTLAKLAVDSYGFHQIENRNAKPACIEMAKNWQIDLSEHRSKWLKYEHCLDKNSLVVILDKKNEYLLQSFYPKIPYISLADLVPKNMGFYHEITDPYDMPADYLKTCYQLIDASLDELIKLLNNQTLSGVITNNSDK